MGVVGELYIAGEGVARGYWNQLEMTKSRFLPNPFSDKTASRMYRTGDLARYRRDGQVQLLGRTDQQIKLRGYRIELGEIEGAIERHPQVPRAAVVLHGGGTPQKLIAYIKQLEAISTADLRAWLQQRLPDYMIPATFAVVDEFPLTPNGKIDRKRLPALPESSTASLATSVVARNQIEELIVRVWSDVLQIGVKSIHDNFFDLGGHSLLLMQVHSRLRSEIDPDLAVVDLFRYPTIESLAAHLEKRQQLHGVASG
jgi:acyl carrier protein